MISPSGWPLRVRYGSLPGRFQTVARAERYAGLSVLRDGPLVECIVSDHLSFVYEGLRWSPADAEARGRHARIWRDIRQAVDQRPTGAPPDFRWVPSHLSAEEAMERGVPLIDWVGNAWADWFAALAVERIRLPHCFSRGL